MLLRCRHPKEGVRRMGKGQTFGARLRQLREAAGLTQQELADRAGMHRFGVAKLERDERHPSWATVQALAGALGLSCAAFEGTVEPPEEPPPKKRGRPRKEKE
jgi:transcriptional regulator with XRE-family HTH domain